MKVLVLRSEDGGCVEVFSDKERLERFLATLGSNKAGTIIHYNTVDKTVQIDFVDTDVQKVFYLDERPLNPGRSG